MKNSYNFFQNTECPYFPCHDSWKEGHRKEEFNCLFCYCPLYRMKDCPGKPEYLINSQGIRIKDCSHCLFPHEPHRYEDVIKCLQNQTEIITVSMDELSEYLMEQMEQMSHWKNMVSESKEWQRETAMSLYEQKFQKKTIRIALQPFDATCIEGAFFTFGEKKIFCQVLERIPKESVVQGYLYAFHAPDVSENDSLLEQFYNECWQIASLDAGRIWLQHYLWRRHSVRTERYVTESFGPGFYGMGPEALETLSGMIPAERVGVRLDEGKVLKPLKSIMGLYLVLDRKLSFTMQDCTGCIGNWKGCSLCGNSKKERK